MGMLAVSALFLGFLGLSQFTGKVQAGIFSFDRDTRPHVFYVAQAFNLILAVICFGFGLTEVLGFSV
jgi:hypothetical protein